jgi:hypothetical protein
MTEASEGTKPPNAAEEDLRLIERVLGRDRQAFEVLVRSHERRVFRITLAVLGQVEDTEDAEEAMQETHHPCSKNCEGLVNGDSTHSVFRAGAARFRPFVWVVVRGLLECSDPICMLERYAKVLAQSLYLILARVGAPAGAVAQGGRQRQSFSTYLPASGLRQRSHSLESFAMGPEQDG